MKRLLVILLVILLGMVVLGKTVTIEFWTLSLSPTFDDYIKAIIEDFEKNNPGIKVNWVDIPYSAAVEKLTAAIAARKAPDVVNLNTSWALDFIAQDALAALDEYIPESVRYVYWENLWNGTMVNGKSYAVPWYASIPIMMYNKELFERAGLDPEDPPQTWEEVTEAARIIKEMTGAYGLEPNIIALDELLLEGIPLVSEDGKKAAFNTPEAVKKLQWFQMLFTEDLMPRSLGGYVEGRQKYSAGQLAMYPAGLTMLKHIEVNSPDIYGVTDVSTYPLGKAKLVKVSLMNMAIPFTSKYKEEAAKFILWATSPYWQVKFSNYATIVPSTKI
jgi:putative chitobiose transport system substrate-binding protein